MHFINDKDFIAPKAWFVARLLYEITDIINPPIRRSVHFYNIYMVVV